MTTLIESEALRIDLDEPGKGGQDGGVRARLSGRLETRTMGPAWTSLQGAVARTAGQRLVLDLEALDYCDSGGAALLLNLKARQEQQGGSFEILDAKPDVQALIELCASARQREPASHRVVHHRSFIERVGIATRSWVADVGDLVAFIGDAAMALASAIVKPRQVRWKDVFRIAEEVGVDAMPIIVMLGFLIGLIMAFQSAIPLRRFGADLFVANLVGLSLFRELGPLITAIILAGRSGSAFAAEIGTMQVKEEVDALTTMGLDPMRFLVIPRLLAAIAMTPLLTIFNTLAGLVGGGVVMASLGFPPVTYVNQIIGAVDYGDFLGGLAKSLVFGILVAGIGCLRGLQTGAGAIAVGASTTSAVVSGIILITVTDGVFAVIFYYLGI